MKKLDIRFDTEVVNANYEDIDNPDTHKKSEVIRAALNYGMSRFNYHSKVNPDTFLELIEEFK